MHQHGLGGEEVAREVTFPMKCQAPASKLKNRDDNVLTLGLMKSLTKMENSHSIELPKRHQHQQEHISRRSQSLQFIVARCKTAKSDGAPVTMA